MKTTAQRAYVFDAGKAQRVIATSKGEVYTPGEGWSKPVEVQVVKVPGIYDRWSDVPAAWLGGPLPWWK